MRDEFESRLRKSFGDSILDISYDPTNEYGQATVIKDITSIPESAFEDCHGLLSINIPITVTSIGYRVFYSCYNLNSVSISKYVTILIHTYQDIHKVRYIQNNPLL